MAGGGGRRREIAKLSSWRAIDSITPLSTSLMPIHDPEENYSSLGHGRGRFIRVLGVFTSHGVAGKTEGKKQERTKVVPRKRVHLLDVVKSAPRVDFVRRGFVLTPLHQGVSPFYRGRHRSRAVKDVFVWSPGACTRSDVRWMLAHARVTIARASAFIPSRGKLRLCGVGS